MPELFRQGTLEMSQVPFSEPVSAMMWSDVLTNRLAVIAAVVLLLVELSDILMLIPHLLRCMPFWKGNAELEHSVSISRTRNTVAFVCGVLFCVIADRYSLLDPSWRISLPDEWQLAGTVALVFGVALLRGLLYLFTPLGSRTNEYACTVRHALYNYFILFVCLAVVSTALMEAVRMPEAAARIIILIEAILLYVVDIWRTAQILSSRYGVFTTILYLCALEFLPLGILILTCTR
ncbi:MAG: DUF4271 domain-containing protein [Bacteroidales bacterium]|nr:DUF4271 domain-containing protein [Bacteroidales bacterium]